MVEGASVGQAIEALLDTWPDLRPHLVDETGSLRSYVNIFVGQTNIRDGEGLEWPLDPDSEVLIIPAIAGGVG